MSPLLGILLGIGLAAATGLRVFLPFLVAGIAARAGWIPLAEGFQWLASMPVLFMLGTATILEILAYYIPGIDHVLDVLATPATVIAGMVVSASVMVDAPPAVMWPVAIIAGGGIAGLMKGSAALVRTQSGLTTGTIGNPAVSTAETVGAILLSILAIAVPILCVIAVVVMLVWGMRRAGWFLFGTGKRRSG